MTSATGAISGGGSSVGGALSLMGCVREASPPLDHRSLPVGHADFTSQRNTAANVLPKETKKRRFHPLKGLRRIFRRKSRGAADTRLAGSLSDRDGDLLARANCEVTLRYPVGRSDEARSRSASELLTDSNERDNAYHQQSILENAYSKFRGGAGQLSVSHDSIFPGEVPQIRPLTSLDTLTTTDRRQSKAQEEAETKDHSHPSNKSKLSLRVLEQIKTVIENRNQVAHLNITTSNPALHINNERQNQDTVEGRFAHFEKNQARLYEEIKSKVTRPVREISERTDTSNKDDLPELETGCLSHTAAHHRMAVRPKNRRPPKSKRSVSQSSTGASTSLITTITESTDDSGIMDSLELASATDSVANSASSSPSAGTKSAPIIRRKSSRLSRSSDIFEELESRLSSTKKTPGSSVSLSPDSLDSLQGRQDEEKSTEDEELPRAAVRKSFSDVSEQSPRRASPQAMDSLEESSPQSNWLLKSDKDNSIEMDDGISKPVPRRRRYLPSMSKSSDSLEVCKDDERLELTYKSSCKLISKSTESFQHSEPGRDMSMHVEMRKRSSTSDVSLPRSRRLSDSKHCAQKLADSLERMSVAKSNNYNSDDGDVEMRKVVERPFRRSSDTRMSSESFDNLDMEDNSSEARQIRRTSKRASSVTLDVGSPSVIEDKRIVGVVRKPPHPPGRLQKSSESSELGSTDTLDSEMRNKSSGSTETLDSLDKDLDQDKKDEDVDNDEKQDKNGSWSGGTSADDSGHVDESDDGSKSLISNSEKYWKSPDSKDNLDIHQLLAITIVSRMADNGNEKRELFNKKQQNPQQKLSRSVPNSPATKSEDNKMLFNNLMDSSNDEDLQNMLNGNISEVSTDTKSFKEKLIMFEKLGK